MTCQSTRCVASLYNLLFPHPVHVSQFTAPCYLQTGNPTELIRWSVVGRLTRPAPPSHWYSCVTFKRVFPARRTWYEGLFWWKCNQTWTCSRSERLTRSYRCTNCFIVVFLFFFQPPSPVCQRVQCPSTGGPSLCSADTICIVNVLWRLVNTISNGSFFSLGERTEERDSALFYLILLKSEKYIGGKADI